MCLAPRNSVVHLPSRNQGRCTLAMQARTRSSLLPNSSTLAARSGRDTGVTSRDSPPAPAARCASVGRSRPSQSSIMGPQMPCSPPPPVPHSGLVRKVQRQLGGLHQVHPARGQGGRQRPRRRPRHGASRQVVTRFPQVGDCTGLPVEEEPPPRKDQVRGWGGAGGRTLGRGAERHRGSRRGRCDRGRPPPRCVRGESQGDQRRGGLNAQEGHSEGGSAALHAGALLGELERDER